MGDERDPHDGSDDDGRDTDSDPDGDTDSNAEGDTDSGHDADTDSDPDPDGDSDPPTEYDPGSRETGHPIDGNALMIASAKASVGAGRLPELLRTADDYLHERADEYERSYERVDQTDGVATYLVPQGHWDELSDALDVGAREADALRRAHEQHLLRVGANQRRRREFESALDLREVVVLRR